NQCFAVTVTGTFCGTKSSFSPGRLKSNGQRYTVGSSSPKLPCAGGQGAVHSSVVAFHALRSVARLPAKMLKKKLNRKISGAEPKTKAEIVMNTFTGCCGTRNMYCVGS